MQGACTSLRLSASPQAPAQARRHAVSVLHTWGLDDLADVGTLLISELVTNVVRHAGSPVAIDLTDTGHGLRVDVHDGDARLPGAPPRPPGAQAEHGRGLLLVEQLAARWGCSPTPAGKVMWFELDR